MAFTEADRVEIRFYTGASSVFLQVWPSLENAITAVQSTGDGGTRPDNSTELKIKALVTELQGIDQRRADLRQIFEGGKVDELTADPVRASMMACRDGRIAVGRLCRMLALRGPLADVFSPQPINPAGVTGL